MSAGPLKCFISFNICEMLIVQMGLFSSLPTHIFFFPLELKFFLVICYICLIIYADMIYNTILLYQSRQYIWWFNYCALPCQFGWLVVMFCGSKHFNSRYFYVLFLHHQWSPLDGSMLC